MNHPRDAAYSMEFVTVVIHRLGSAITKVRRFFRLFHAHAVEFASWELTHFDRNRLEVNDEDMLIAINASQSS